MKTDNLAVIWPRQEQELNWQDLNCIIQQMNGIWAMHLGEPFKQQSCANRLWKFSERKPGIVDCCLVVHRVTFCCLAFVHTENIRETYTHIGISDTHGRYSATTITIPTIQKSSMHIDIDIDTHRHARSQLSKVSPWNWNVFKRCLGIRLNVEKELPVLLQ